MKKVFVASLCAILNMSAMAADVTANLKAAVSNLIPAAEIELVRPAGKAGLYELVTPRGIFYTDEQGSFVIFGQMVDPLTKTSITQQRLEALAKFEFSELPLGDAIKTVRGNGNRVMATFEDPNCGYCKKLMAELQKLDNVTIYTFLMPVLSPDSRSKATAIWCSKDPAKAWSDWMIRADAPTLSDCANPIDRNLALARRLRVSATPAILFQSNSRIPGYVVADQIEAKLSAASR